MRSETLITRGDHSNRPDGHIWTETETEAVYCRQIMEMKKGQLVKRVQRDKDISGQPNTLSVKCHYSNEISLIWKSISEIFKRYFWVVPSCAAFSSASSLTFCAALLPTLRIFTCFHKHSSSPSSTSSFQASSTLLPSSSSLTKSSSFSFMLSSSPTSSRVWSS